jgi:excisionase family DNA binding protein
MDHRSKNQVSPEKLLVKVPVAAAMMDQCARTVKRLIDQGKLQSVKCGRSRLVVVASIHAYISRLLQQQKQSA